MEFLRVLGRERTPRRFTYLCGREGVLVEEAVDAVRRTVGADQMNRVTLFAGQDSTGDIWSEMSQYALDSQMTRLVTVRDAQKLKGWDKFEPWLLGSRNAKSVHVLMVANEDEWRADYQPEARSRMLRSSQAIYVQCEIPKNEPYKAIAKIIPKWSLDFGEVKRDSTVVPWPIAEYLAERTGGNLARCRDVCRWVNLMHLKEPPSERLIDVLTELNPQDSFVTALLRVDKKMALRMAPGVDNPSNVIRKLTVRLNELDKVNRALKVALVKRDALQNPDQVIRDISMLSGLPNQTVRELWRFARHYDARGISRKSELLCVVDEHRNKEGVLEVLVAEW